MTRAIDYAACVIPHVAPPVYPSPIRQGRFASTIVLNTPELAEATGARAGESAVSKCAVGLLGIPDDTGIEMNHGRVGAAQGPHAFRAALARYGAASPMDVGEGQRAATLPRVFDAGDVVPGATLDQTHERVTAATRAILGLGLFPIAIGGGHDLTFPFVRAVSQPQAGGPITPLGGVYLDAHLDVRPEPGSGMAFRTLLEQGYIGAGELTCLGVDPLANTAEHFEYFRGMGGSVEVFEPAQWHRGAAAPWPLDGGAMSSGSSVARSGPSGEFGQFVSLDLDVIDMAFAPGVSAMNPSGWMPGRVGAYVEAAGMCPAVRCFDIMELSPPHDENGRTARLAAWMFLRFLRGLGLRGQ